MTEPILVIETLRDRLMEDMEYPGIRSKVATLLTLSWTEFVSRLIDQPCIVQDKIMDEALIILDSEVN